MLPPPTYLTIPPTGFQYNSSGLQLRKLQDAYSENNNLKPKSKGKKKKTRNQKPLTLTPTANVEHSQMPRHISINPHTTGSGSHDPIKHVWISTKITSHAKHQGKKKKNHNQKR